jgi:hypothetical protein
MGKSRREIHYLKEQALIPGKINISSELYLFDGKSHFQHNMLSFLNLKMLLKVLIKIAVDFST